MKWILYILFALLYLIVTFFGLGPVLFADGSTAERMVTLVVVLLVYVLITLWLRSVLKRLRHR
ncbi:MULTISPECIES: DUF6954 family protein [Paenibacillus]|uniref:Uncharacterized protein n=1 Tax=Paenibacillus tianjinensis TaxID=2810347 RepID=A0ABX7LHB9_9BACL|nr:MULTISPECIES: hypothetical protein [Paenibacillus]QSF46758.1 hypothetical protein JRJ22_09425 [Paenibacillus tianjinensis]